MERKRTAVLVAGSWGTALARVLADNGHEVALWTRTAEQAHEINTQRRNVRYLPDTELPAGIRAVERMEDALQGAELALFAAPSAAMRDVARMASAHLETETLVVHATKGFERDTMKRMSVVLAEELNRDNDQIVCLSGPSHAEEVALRHPTTVVVASPSLECSKAAQDYFMNNSYFRVYTNRDLLGVEISGAVKNIIALGAGLSDGLGFGDNAKAALITRGLAEIARLGIAMGANPLTFVGLAGVGDLVGTCTSRHSRNWRAGSMLAQGLPLTEVLSRMGMVVEGVRTTESAYALSRQYKVEMPITEQLHAVLFEGKSPKQAVLDLMARDKTHEDEEMLSAVKDR